MSCDRGGRGKLTRVERGLQRRESVVLQHVQEGLDISNAFEPEGRSHSFTGIVQTEEQELCA